MLLALVHLALVADALRLCRLTLARALLQQAVLLTLPVLFLFGVALFVLPLSLRQSDLQLYEPLAVVQVKRHQRIAGAFDLADQLADLVGLQ